MKQIAYLKQEWVMIEGKDNKTIITPLSKLTNNTFTIKTQLGNRTNNQNKSLHLYCQKVADTLNDAGLTVHAVLNHKRYAKIEKAFENAKKMVSLFPKAIKVIERLEELVFEKEEVEIEWTMQLVKDIIWRKIQLVVFKDKESTTQLKRDEVSRVYEAIDYYLSSRFGIESIDFPSWEKHIMDIYSKNN
jgi:hypothetical protein